ncbi:lysine-2,3-aminomutase-like protein [Kaistia algarum]|uniref:lysine-2,3-aminomutase-like protein n=1 Tax=Kaistia algarum TaxID=2083279 RepID=UPI000CE79B4E|nr:lysine-2,3-aminomutase-like protein [Kaistia algarum]MCX5514600.1 lysine-2,3-aminomutase-like protein [Kaistia algarum]PPE78958.1 lysine-2,3-aminomutase-like protein [Kaistia algarum]
MPRSPVVPIDKPLTLRTPASLIEAGLAPPEALGSLQQVGERYAIAVTPSMAALIDPADPNDPIARQFIPDPRELEFRPEERADPIGDDAHSPVPGLVHRYPDRVLLKLVHVCAVYCRFCFRRESVGPGGPTLMGEAELEAALAYLRTHPEIWEIVLTGGDPLVIAPRKLAGLLERLAAVEPVRILRFHTRVPIVDPARITPELVSVLRNCGKTVYVAVHANHPRELTAEARAALARLADAGIALVSQTVLLKGINDDPETMAALMRGFVEARVKPYYLHHGDLAPGTAHFRTSIDEGRALMRALRGRLSGLAQPTYVLDIPGGYGKVPVGPDYVGDGIVIDPDGNEHAYGMDGQG